MTLEVGRSESLSGRSRTYIIIGAKRLVHTVVTTLGLLEELLVGAVLVELVVRSTVEVQVGLRELPGHAEVRSVGRGVPPPVLLTEVDGSIGDDCENHLVSLGVDGCEQLAVCSGALTLVGISAVKLVRPLVHHFLRCSCGEGVKVVGRILRTAGLGEIEGIIGVVLPPGGLEQADAGLERGCKPLVHQGGVCRRNDGDVVVSEIQVLEDLLDDQVTGVLTLEQVLVLRGVEDLVDPRNGTVGDELVKVETGPE